MKEMGKALLLAVIAATAVSACGKKGKSAADENSDFGICKKAMIAVARDPGSVQVPEIEPTETAGNLVFEWGEKTAMLTMRNSRGLDVPVSGTCALNKESKAVAYVLMNGAVVH